MRSRATHQSDAIDHHSQVLGEDGVDGVVIGGQFKDVDTEASDGGHQGKVLGTGLGEVDGGRALGKRKQKSLFYINLHIWPMSDVAILNVDNHIYCIFSNSVHNDYLNETGFKLLY